MRHQSVDVKEMVFVQQTSGQKPSFVERDSVSRMRSSQPKVMLSVERHPLPVDRLLNRGDLVSTSNPLSSEHCLCVEQLSRDAGVFQYRRRHP